MSKVEELAKKYCEGSSFEDACMEKPAYIAGYHQAEKDLHKSIYKAGFLDGFEDAVEEQYEKGYEQAKKDLELTWEDVRDICSIQYIVLNEYNDYDEPSSSILYQEVLKRFKKQKDESKNLEH